MVKPERRTRGDLIAALVIVVVLVAAGVVIWLNSDARATVSRPAAGPATTVGSARAVPTSVVELWRARSDKTPVPVVVGSTITTATGGEVVGHDPVTGAVRWTYARDRDLCGVTWIYESIVAVYPDRRGCGQVSTIDAATGERGPTRTAFADNPIQLSTDGTTVLAAGRTHLEMWRSDMVRTLMYGDLDAPVNPPVPKDPPCQFLSSAASTEGVTVMETCTDFTDVRLTTLKVSKEDVAPEQQYALQPGIKADSGARVLAMAGMQTLAYLPLPEPRAVVFGEKGAETSSTMLDRPPTAGAVSQVGDLITYWTGDSVMIFDATTLEYRYTVTSSPTVSPVGPGAVMANKLLIPITGGIGVYDIPEGKGESVIPVDRPATKGPVTLGVLGTTIVEQYDGDLVALGEPA